MIRVVTDDRCALYRFSGHPEHPGRIVETVRHLRGLNDPSIEWLAPGPVDQSLISAVHHDAQVACLASALPHDADTPGSPEMGDHARRAVGAALTAMESALAGIPALSLMRPPGHHATDRRAMGFCYLNQVAITALEAARRGMRVAIFDFDVHHGNGTEAIVHGREGVAFWSVHQFPAYPGTGSFSRDNCFNAPMAPDTPRAAYLEALLRAIDQLDRFDPDLVAVSAGFDAFRGDPLAEENLEGEDYRVLGSTLAGLGIPTFAVLEGGYSPELPGLVTEFMRGLGQ